MLVRGGEEERGGGWEGKKEEKVIPEFSRNFFCHVILFVHDIHTGMGERGEILNKFHLFYRF
mgnify:CR=1 FL=1